MNQIFCYFYPFFDSEGSSIQFQTFTSCVTKKARHSSGSSHLKILPSVSTFSPLFTNFIDGLCFTLRLLNFHQLLFQSYKIILKNASFPCFLLDQATGKVLVKSGATRKLNNCKLKKPTQVVFCGFRLTQKLSSLKNLTPICKLLRFL